MKKFALVSMFAGLAMGSDRPPEGFADVQQIQPAIETDIRYFGEDNFIGKRIPGYRAPKCILTEAAGNALAQAWELADKKGYGLKVFDCYRPQRAVDHFLEWAQDPRDVKMKEIYYPNVAKKDLIPQGYIAKRSGHSRGSTLDLTLTKSGEEVEMGSIFDFFDPISHTDNPSAGEQARKNRLLLRSIMQEAGFRNYSKEWWHFTLNEEPHPQSYFNFPVR